MHRAQRPAYTPLASGLDLNISNMIASGKKEREKALSDMTLRNPAPRMRLEAVPVNTEERVEIQKAVRACKDFKASCF